MGAGERQGGGAREARVDLGSLSTPFTPLDEARAAGVARGLYGIEGRMTRLATEKDDTFRLETADGRSRILKIANPGESFAELDMQVSLLRHVARRDPRLPVPEVFDDLAGRAISVVPEAAGPDGGGGRLVRLLGYLPGTVLDTLASRPEERERVGRVLARLRLALADFAHPAARRVLAWDVRHLPSLAPLLDHVDDPAHRTALAAGLARFEAFVPGIAGLRCQVLHNDFSRSNIVVDRTRPEFVVGIVDFGDAMVTAIAVDVATAMLNQLPVDDTISERRDLFAEARDLLRGYREVADLMDEELALIPHLVMGRVITRALLTQWRAGMFPANSRYILRNTGPGWAQLAWFLERSADEISGLLL